jgi:hypothetical protein
MGQHQSSAQMNTGRVNVIASGFEVKRASEAREAWVADENPLRIFHGTALPAKRSQTVSRDYAVSLAVKLTDTFNVGHTRVRKFPQSPSVGKSWLAFFAERRNLPENWAGVLSEIEEYSSFAAGWRGQGSSAVSAEAKDQALVLARKFAESLPHGYIPMIGADDDGCIVMTWDEGELIGNLSVRGTGFYAYFVERAGVVEKDGKAAISLPIAPPLLALLAPAAT